MNLCNSWVSKILHNFLIQLSKEFKVILENNVLINRNFIKVITSGQN